MIYGKVCSSPVEAMAGTRDRVIHHYFGVNPDIMWQIVTDELPAVASELKNLLGEEGHTQCLLQPTRLRSLSTMRLHTTVGPQS